MHLSLKTKISTPLIEESVGWYKAVFGMVVAEQWNSPGDRGAILAFNANRTEAFLEIYHCEESHDFAGLSLQFRVQSMDRFIEGLPASIEYEGPKPRPWGSTYLYLRDPNGVSIIVYEGGL